MSVTVIVGGQWGDEGKGKIVDLLAEQASFVVRYSGGDNAGHTVVNASGEFALHLVPSGIFRPDVTAVIGNGVAINPAVLLREVQGLQSRGVDASRLRISTRANVIMPYHVLFDIYEEQARGQSAIGTTRKGIGPAFADKVARLGIRVGDLLDPDCLRRRLKPILDQKNVILSKVFDAKPLSLDEICDEYSQHGKNLAPFVCETDLMLAQAMQQGQSILLEGAQGSLLDPDFGSYPYVTSSSPLAGGASLGSGIAPRSITDVVGVFKAYITRVGGGPMPTELADETGSLIRERAREYGTTTGRPRRCGWFDGVAARFSARINGMSGVALTRLDVLDVLPVLKICTAYELDGRRIDDFPCSVEALARCRPIYEDMPGWLSPTSEARKLQELPEKALRYVRKLEQILCCRVSIVSVGARREQTIMV